MSWATNGSYSPAKLIRLAFPPAAVVLMLATFSTTSRVRSYLPSARSWIKGTIAPSRAARTEKNRYSVRSMRRTLPSRAWSSTASRTCSYRAAGIKP